MRDRVVRVFGEMAVFTAEVDDETPGKGVSKTRVTDVWLRRKGRWLFVQSHESLIE
jgi:phosphoribosylaminoimidazole-succinocarboxamide synthase